VCERFCARLAAAVLAARSRDSRLEIQQESMAGNDHKNLQHCESDWVEEQTVKQWLQVGCDREVGQYLSKI
jgi:ribosomal protein L15E